MTKVYQRIASLLTSISNCQKAGNAEWAERHAVTLGRVMIDAPSGSGFDAGTTIDHDTTRVDRLVFDTTFHHMNDGGFYDGWTEHMVIITPSFTGFDIRVTGRDKRDIKAYIVGVFHNWLNSECQH